MAQVTIYLPDELRDAAKDAGLNVSRIARDAIQAYLNWIPERVTTPPPPVGCTEMRHVGPLKRLGYATQCEGCGQAVR